MKSLKINVFIAMCLLNFPIVFASTHQTMSKCLGLEEYFIFKNKIKGPIYKINQDLIAFISSKPDLILSDKIYNEICSNISKTNSPSLNILEHIIANKSKNKFKIYSTDIILIFLKFIQDVQKIAPTYNCLDKQVPYLKKYKDYVRFIGLDVNLKNINLSTEQYHQLFSKLKDINKLFAKCKSEKIKKPN